MGNMLEGKVAVITGGSSGIGLATARRFADEGAQVVITGRRRAELDLAVAQIGDSASGFQADVLNVPDIKALYEFVAARHGRVDIVIANAGAGSFAKLGAITQEYFDKEFGTNVRGTLFTVQEALPLMTRGGSIVLLGSAASITTTPEFSVYSATKGAVRNLMRNWVLDLRGTDIRVNVLSPGPIRTPGLGDFVPPDQQSAFFKGFAEQIPLGRIGEPDDIANVALFLASDASSFVNGVELFVDGGFSLA